MEFTLTWKKDQDEALAEAKALGEIPPCHWTAAQRERVIALTGMAPAAVDEMIACSRMMNGLDPPGPLLAAILDRKP